MAVFDISTEDELSGLQHELLLLMGADSRRHPVDDVLNCIVIERSGNYGLVLLMPVIFFILAALTMQGVTRGEARAAVGDSG
ncbi:MAG: hypothetical protein R6T96_06605 [Longimicrobiales bacterium]